MNAATTARSPTRSGGGLSAVCAVVPLWWNSLLRILTHRPNIHLHPDGHLLLCNLLHMSNWSNDGRSVLGLLEEFHKLWRRIVKCLSRGLMAVELALLICEHRLDAKLHCDLYGRKINFTNSTTLVGVATGRDARYLCPDRALPRKPKDSPLRNPSRLIFSQQLLSADAVRPWMRVASSTAAAARGDAPEAASDRKHPYYSNMAFTIALLPQPTIWCPCFVYSC